jgi:hypothetical protein
MTCGTQIEEWKGKKTLRAKQKGQFIDDTFLDVPFSSSNNALFTECK